MGFFKNGDFLLFCYCSRWPSRRPYLRRFFQGRAYEGAASSAPTDAAMLRSKIEFVPCEFVVRGHREKGDRRSRPTAAWVASPYQLLARYRDPPPDNFRVFAGRVRGNPAFCKKRVPPRFALAPSGQAGSRWPSRGPSFQHPFWAGQALPLPRPVGLTCILPLSSLLSGFPVPFLGSLPRR